MRGSHLTGAKRYARALLDVAEKKGESAAVDKALSAFAALVAGNEELRTALGNPAIPHDKRKAITGRILGKASPLVAGFLGILFDHEQFELLPLVARSFHEAFNTRRGVTTAEAVSATPLDGAQTKALEKALSGRQGGPVELATRSDPSLIGGIVVRMGGMTYDGSVRAQLRALKQALAGGS
jgi:F-type H+-transporting ATPase subunit delta